MITETAPNANEHDELVEASADTTVLLQRTFNQLFLNHGMRVGLHIGIEMLFNMEGAAAEGSAHEEAIQTLICELNDTLTGSAN
jgi:hypothetical protein